MSPRDCRTMPSVDVPRLDYSRNRLHSVATRFKKWARDQLVGPYPETKIDQIEREDEATNVISLDRRHRWRLVSQQSERLNPIGDHRSNSPEGHGEKASPSAKQITGRSEPCDE